jgi:putative FmdB family regulatory protein
MPIYEYLCDSCGKIVETLQRVSDPPLVDCPSGDGGGLTRILSAHNVGGMASGAEATSCDRSPEPTCGGCNLAGTGCS